MPKLLVIVGIIVGIIVALLGIYLGFGSKYLQKPQLQKYTTGPVEDIRLGVSSAGQQLSALIYIADKKGYFIDNKLNVIFTVDPNSTVSRKNVANGVEDLGTTSDFGFVGDSFTPTNLRILAVISNTKLIEIIGRKDKGITSPVDLKGKKIAVNLKSSGQFFFGEFLTFNNLRLSDVIIVPTNLDKAQDAIVSGVVDAVVTNDPYAYQIKQALGKNAVELSASLLDRNNNLLLISSKEAIKSRPAVIERFLNALLHAEDFAKTNPEESKRIIGDKFKFDQAFLNQTWPKNTFALSLGQSLLLGMEDEARWSIENKLTDQTKVPNYLNYIYFDALQKVKPEAITIEH